VAGALAAMVAGRAVISAPPAWLQDVLSIE